MVRGVVAFFILAALAGALGYRWYKQQIELQQRQQEQIVELNREVKKLQSDNETLKAQLAKVQEEEGRLAATNELLIKAIEQSRLSGKIPEKLPYPPK